ncbi:MAG: PQQ-binding-like beta-propeller repeat protein [Phycisphaeraceae bacterium]
MKHWHCLTAVVVMAIGLLGGCQGGDGNGPRLLVDPLDAQQLGYTVDWQIDLALPEQSQLMYAELLGDRLVTVEDQNIVSVIDADNGDILWRHQVTRPTDQLSRPQRDGDRLVISSQRRAYVLNIDDGEIQSIIDLLHVSLGTPVVHNGLMIHASPRGVLFAQELDSGLLAWDFQVDVGFASAPTLTGGRIFATDLGGNVWSFDPLEGTLRWTRAVAEPVVAHPEAGERLVYVPSTDYSLYAMRLSNGSVQARHYATGSLDRSPFLVNGLLLQAVSDDAMLSLNPEDIREVRWRSEELVDARPIQVRGTTLDLYQDGQLIHIDTGDGSEIGATDLGNVRHVLSTSRTGGTLYLLQLNGRILKASPR